MQVAQAQELQEREQLRSVRERLLSTCVQMGAGRDACLQTPVNAADMDQTLEHIRNGLGSSTAEEAVETLLATHASNFDLFCAVNKVDMEISNLKADIQTVRSDTQVNRLPHFTWSARWDRVGP